MLSMSDAERKQKSAENARLLDEDAIFEILPT